MIRKLLPGLLKPLYWVTLLKEIRLVWQIARDGRVPVYLKVLPFLFVAYMLFPIDIVPDLLPVIGQIDDLALLMLGTQLFIRLAPDAVVADYRELE